MYLLISEKFGKLHAKESQEVNQYSSKKIFWVCTCGKEKLIRISDVINHRTKSCGNCNLVTAKELSKIKFGSLTVSDPIDVKPGSNNKIGCNCDCGRKADPFIYKLFDHSITSCGKCNLITTEEIKNKPYGDLIIETPQNVLKGSSKKVWWLCKCGKKIYASIYEVTSHTIVSCGKCNLVTAAEMTVRKFRKLKMETPHDILSGSGKRIWWSCACGGRIYARIIEVFKGDTTCCGNCSKSIRNWYVKNKNRIKSLKCPVQIHEFPMGGIIPLEVIRRVKDPFKASCPICNFGYKPTLDAIKRGVSLTCGCSYNKISFAHEELTEFIQSIGVDVEIEYKVGTLKYDIFVPSHNLLIEYNGLKWHSEQYSKERDTKKYNNAISNRYNYLMIFEDEWKYNREKIKLLLYDKFKKFEIKEISISKCQFNDTKLTYEAVYENKVIAHISFHKLLNDDWIIDDLRYRASSAFNRLINEFISEYSPKSIIVFSDNRLSDGSIYGNIGFEFKEELPPDYYWIKGQRRFNKQDLCKNGENKLSEIEESQLRESQKYRKIWDLGEKKWILNLV